MPLVKKYGIIADIHANYTALQVALDYLAKVRVDKILCLGDLVGYGAEPFECIDTVKDKPNIFCIAGNHDLHVIGDRDIRMRQKAKKVLEWTASKISLPLAQFLKQMPQRMTIDDTFIMIHDSLVERHGYILTPDEIRNNFHCMQKDYPSMKVCFFGHTHVPRLIGSKSISTELRETKTFQLDPRDIYLINPGSVGQPRDRCPLASFGIFDAETWQMTFIRKPYDFYLAQRRIIDSGLLS